MLASISFIFPCRFSYLDIFSFNAFIRRLACWGVRMILDFTFAYRLYPKKALKGYRIRELRHGFALEILLSPMRKGYKVITLPAKWKKRVEGNSSITIHSYFSYLKVLFRNL